MTIFLDFLQVKSTQVFIRDSSMVHPVALICFSGKDVRAMHHGMYGYFDNIMGVFHLQKISENF